MPTKHFHSVQCEIVVSGRKLSNAARGSKVRRGEGGQHQIHWEYTQYNTGTWRGACSAVKALLSARTGYFLEIGGFTQKLQIMKTPWAGLQSGLVVRSLQNYFLSITYWDKLKLIGVIELTCHRIQWQLPSVSNTNNWINFPCLWKRSCFQQATEECRLYGFEWEENTKRIQSIFLNVPFSLQPGKIFRSTWDMILRIFTSVW